MIIERRRSVFSQFTKDEWLNIQVNGMSIDFDLDESEVIPFIISMLSLCESLMYSADRDYSEEENKISEIIQELNK